MQSRVRFIERWLMGTSWWGGVLFLGILLLNFDQLNFFHEAEMLLVFGVGVTIPLALHLVSEPDRQGNFSAVFKAIALLHPAVILAIVIGLQLDHGNIATVLATAWLINANLMGFYGLQRLVIRPALAIEEICLAMALLYLPVSGVWFVAYQANISLFSFDSSLVLLTAVHFAYIGPGALVMGGMVGRNLRDTAAWQIYRYAAVILVISPAIVAAGITFTQFSGILWLELGSAILLSSSLLLLLLLHLTQKMSPLNGSAILTRLSMTTLLLTMTLAIAYPLGRITELWSLSLHTMVRWHGWFNAVGFVFLGLLGFTLMKPTSHMSPIGIPFSKLTGHWHIGANYFEREQAIDYEDANPPNGIVDRLQDYQQHGFDVDVIPPEITAFYEHTADHVLLVCPEWKQGFHTLARIYKQISKRIGQMNLPLNPDSDETHITSRIVPIRDHIDGRRNVRGWVRTYTESNEAVYVAAYSTHYWKDARYMNIAFPLPFGNLTSILKLNNLEPTSKGIELTSFSTLDGDQGVYFANRFVPIRLPINEVITVYAGEGYPSDFSKGEIIAKHEMWLLGYHCLTLHYSISKG